MRVFDRRWFTYAYYIAFPVLLNCWMLSPEEYRDLSDEEKKAYQYCEYTPAWGNRAILRRFKQAVMDRIHVWNNHISWHQGNQEISLSDVRVLLIMD